MNEFQLTGLNEEHLTYCHKLKITLHKEAELPLIHLKEEAQAAGFDLRVLSSFRSFESQLAIWNAKARGERKLLSHQGLELDYQELSKEEVLWRILRWSALPGFSRHHWGSELDVYDKNALPDQNYSVELTPNEVATDGIFGPFHDWLSNKIETDQAFGFFRPYQSDLGGVAPEMWHISYAPVSISAREQLDFKFFQEFLGSVNAQEIELLELVKANREQIFQQFILNITPPQSL